MEPFDFRKEKNDVFKDGQTTEKIDNLPHGQIYNLSLGYGNAQKC